nr:TetR/AcrR family transcriptional regulator C-terminal domain-containing protein [Micromonospora sp. DSM 115978]
MPRPRSLTPDAIAAAALTVLDRDGLAALSMRVVAAELGMGTMSLYRYLDDRAELERLVVDHILTSVDLATPLTDRWDRRLATLCRRVRDAVAAHPAVIPLMLTHRHACVGTLHWGEAMMTVLAGAGFTDERRVIAFRALLAYVIGALQSDRLGPLSGAGTAALARLPRHQFPLLAETAGRAGRITPAEEFRRGLDLVLAGLAHTATNHAREGNP